MNNMFNQNMKNYTTAQFYKIMRFMLSDAAPSEYVFVSLDFDNFKYVNDLFGYEFGDRVLISITRHFSEQLHDGEIFSRLNADHFIFLVKALEADALVERFLKMLDVKNCLASLLPEHYNFIASAGFFYIENTTEKTSSILDKASFARKQAKGNYTSTILCYNQSMSDELKWKKEITISMNQALKNKEFEMYLQPKVLIKDSSVVGAEALVRWKHKQHGMILPDQFIPILEQNGFIKLMDFYMLEQACIFLKKCITNNSPVLPISVNFSKINISSSDFVDKILNLVNQYKLSTNLIEIELTESVFSQDFSTLVSISERLSNLGFRVSLDDFGSAYSSLSYLKNFPVDTIKIDKSFLNTSTNTSKGQLIIAKTVEMIKDLHLITVVEGIENERQVAFLKTLDCEIGQGYFYARPMPVAQYEDFLGKNTIGNIESIKYNKLLPVAFEKTPSFEDNNWDLYVIGKNIDVGLIKCYLDRSTVQYINQKALSYLGYTAEEFQSICHNTIEAFTHPDDVANIIACNNHLIKTGVPIKFKARAIRKDAKIICLSGHASCVLDEDQRLIGIYTFQDITENLSNTNFLQHSLQNKINELELLYSTISEGAVHCNLDEDFTLLYYNDVFLALTGYDKQELQDLFANKLLNIIVAEDRDFFNKALLESSLSDANIEISFRIKHKSGKDIDVLQKGQIVEAEDGSQQLYCLFIDITDDKSKC